MEIYRKLIETLAQYKGHGAEVRYHRLGDYVVIVECNDYMIYEHGLCRYLLFDTKYNFITAIPNDVDVTIRYSDNKRLVLTYIESMNKLKNRLTLETARLMHEVGEEEFKYYLEYVLSDRTEYHMQVYTYQYEGWGIQYPRWVLTQFNQ